MAEKSDGAVKRCIGFASELEKIASQYSVSYFDAGVVTEASAVDGVHLDENQHRLLGEAIAHHVSGSLAVQI